MILLLWTLLLSTPTASPGPQDPGRWTPRFEFHGPVPGAQLGARIANLGDVDGDGVPDLGATIGGPGPGAVFVVSGADGRRLYRLEVPAGDPDYGESLASVGDLDGDGRDDFLVSAPNEDIPGRRDSGIVYAHSGADGSVLFVLRGLPSTWGLGSAQFGIAMTGLGDVSGDGVPDFAVGSPLADPRGNQNSGKVEIFSGADGTRLQTITGHDPSSEFGTALTAADVDADGILELVVGAPKASERPDPWHGRVYIHSALDGTLIRRIDPPDPLLGSLFGDSLARMGDINGDGADEIAVGHPNAGPDSEGLVYILSGASGAVVHQIQGSRDSGFGSALAAGGDANGDGVPDLLVGAPRAHRGSWDSTGAVALFSGADGSLLLLLQGRTARDIFGTGVAFGGDADGDGTDDIVISAPYADLRFRPYVGAVYALSYEPFLWAEDREVSISAHETLTLHLDFPPSAGGETWQLLLSATGTGPAHLGLELRIPLTPDDLFLRTLRGDYSMLGASSQGMTGVLDPAGDGQALLDFPPGQPGAAAGRVFYAAALAWRASGRPHLVSAPVAFVVTP